MKPIKNIFFQRALEQAAVTLTNKNRIMRLVSQLLLKSRSLNWQKLNAQAVKSRFFLFGRICKAYATGKYRDVSWKTMLLVVAAVIYFVSPLDFIPDLVPIAGLTDDFAILMWVYNSINNEVEKFITWERSQPIAV